MRRTIGLFVAVAAFLAAMVFTVSDSRADTFVVDSEADSHDVMPGDGVCGDNADPGLSRCTLRAAVEECDALPGADTILVSGDTVVIYITLGPLRLQNNGTTIIGSDGYPVIDGVANLLDSDILDIESDGNCVRGVTIRRARGHGIRISGTGNLVGGEAAEDRVVFVGNGGSDTEKFAVAISSGELNRISGCYFGMHGNGAEVYANQNGILISDSARDNVIEGCLISGNSGYGVMINSLSHGNVIRSSLIGPDITGKSGPRIQTGGVLLLGGAYDNHVGDGTVEGRNIISANAGDGVAIQGMSTDQNQVSGNYIGLDVTGTYSVSNGGNGVSIYDGAQYNLVGDSSGAEHNIISGNVGDGVHITGAGTDFNVVADNFVGLSRYGGGTIGGDAVNTNGVVIAGGARENLVGGMSPASRNLVSSNKKAGVLISDPGTSGNRIMGNFIGVSVYGISSVENGSGVLIQNGASENVVGGTTVGERNIISGNRADVFPYGGGVLIYGVGTDYNIVQGNYIGTDTAGTRALRNGSAGVIIGSGARYNLIGGSEAGEGNIISGNGYGDYSPTLARGVHICGEGTDYNKVSGNRIGLSSYDSLAVPNAGHGVGITDGARFSMIGGTTPEEGNIIAGNEGFGLYMSGPSTERNTARYNNYIDNDSTAIVIRDGAQDGIAITDPMFVTTGDLSGTGLHYGDRVDAYLTWSDASGVFEGTIYLASGRVNTFGDFHLLLPGLSLGDSVCAMVTDTLGNSSAFTPNVVISMYSDVVDTSSPLPYTFSLKQNYPNPFNPSTRIAFTLPRASRVQLEVLNVLGQQVTTLHTGRLSAGEHAIEWDGTDAEGESVASGVYFYRLTTDSLRATRKMLLLK